MKVQAQINDFIKSQMQSKRSDLQALHEIIQQLMPNTQLWFLDGKNDQGKIVANPNIGYGNYTIKYADGTTKEFYQIGLSANTTGISVYIMGIKDKQYLPTKYASSIGKASVTGYCIKFKSLKDIDVNVLIQAMKDGVELSHK